MKFINVGFGNMVAADRDTGARAALPPSRLAFYARSLYACPPGACSLGAPLA